MAMPKRQSPRKSASYGPPNGDAGHVAETALVPYGSAREQWIAASDFKAQCLELMDQVHDRHESLVITKYGRPVAKLVPLDEAPIDIVGFMQGTVLDYGDLISPIDEPWDATS
jgi:prevent-host-death family protein